MKTIQKRAPAVQRAIARYNNLCEDLKDLAPDGCELVLPQPLTIEISKLKDDPALLEDVWLGDLQGRDQYVTYRGEEVEMHWHGKPSQCEVAHKRNVCQLIYLPDPVCD